MSWRKNRKEKERKGSKKEWHGETKLQWARPITLFSKGTFKAWLVHRGKWKMQSHAESAQTLHLFCLYWSQDFFLHTFPINNVVYNIFWPWRPVDILWPFFDKGCSTRKLIFLWSVFSLFLPASESTKQSYILTEQRCSGSQQRKNQLAQRSDVVNSKAATCFSYIPTMLTNALPGAHG